MLQALGRREEALTAIEEAAGVYRGLAAAHPDAYRPNPALADLRRLVAEGARSDGWDFTADLDRAGPDNDPRLLFLSALAEVISWKAEASTLDQFPEWTGAADG